jgi:hypothetical protein
MMVRLANLAMTRWCDGEAVKSNAMRSFRAMAKAVRSHVGVASGATAPTLGNIREI